MFCPLTYFLVRTSYFTSIVPTSDLSKSIRRLPRWRFGSMTQTYPFAVLNDEFKSKRVLVTGGTKGMGEAILRRFLLSGSAVATTARSPLPEGQNPSLFVQTDIGTPEGVRKVVER